MGQKTHPKGFRVGIIRPWDSTWYARFKDYAGNVAEDAKKLVLGSYYYIYNTATSTDVDLRNTEGILVAVAETNTDGGNYLAAFTDWSKFNEGGKHDSVDPQSQPQEANPKTGMFISVLSLAILTGGIILISLKNKQHIFKI